MDHYYISEKKKCHVSCNDNIDSGGNLSDHNSIGLVMSVVLSPVVDGVQQSDRDTLSLHYCKWNAVNFGRFHESQSGVMNAFM